LKAHVMPESGSAKLREVQFVCINVAIYSEAVNSNMVLILRLTN